MSHDTNLDNWGGWFPMEGISPEGNAVGTIPDPLYDEPVPEEFTFGEEFTGSMVSTSPFMAAAVGPSNEVFESEYGYDPIADPSISQYDANIFVGSRSSQETQARIANINYVREMRKRDKGLFGSPASALGTLAGVVTNPLYIGAAFVPGGLPAVIAAEMAAETANEMLLSSQQPERTKTESAINIATTGLLTGVVAGAVVYFGRNSMAVPELPDAVGPDPSRTEMKRSGGLSADVAFPDPEELFDPVMVQNPALVRGMGGSVLSPGVDVAVNSPLETAKRTMNELADVATEFESGKVGDTVEAEIKSADGDIFQQDFGIKESFKKYRDGGGEMKLEEFQYAVSDAINNMDTHPISEVQTVARHYRKFDTKYFDEAKAQGLYGDEPPVGNKSHQQRIYMKGAIERTRPELERRILAKLGTSERLIIRTPEGTFTIEPATLPGLQQKYGKDLQLLDSSPESLPGVTRSIVDTILGDKRGSSPDFADLDHVVPLAGSLHERTLNFMSYDDLKPWLEKNASAVLAVTTNQMTRSIAMARRFGDVNMEKRLDEIKEEYDTLRETLKTGDERVALAARWRKDVKSIKGVRDILHGTYGRPDPTSSVVQTGRILKMGTLLSYGLNIPLSSLSDIIGPALRNGFKPFYQGLRVLASTQRKEYRKTIQMMGLATNAVTNARALALANTAFMKPWEKKAHRAWAKWTGLNWFTDLTQGWNAMGTSEMWLGWIKNGTSTENLAKMESRGLGQVEIARVNRQIKKYSKTEDGITLPETHKWNDRDIARIYESALRTEVHSTTLLPGASDMPLWTKTEAGGFVTQFMSFVTSAHNKFLISGMQRRDADFFMGVLAMTAMGAVTVGIKDTIRGQDVSDKTIGRWITDSVDRSGTAGWMMPPVNMGFAFFSDTPPSSYVARRKGMDLITPAPIKFGSDLVQTGAGILNGEDEAGWRALRLVPFANTGHAVNLAERFVKDEN